MHINKFMWKSLSSLTIMLLLADSYLLKFSSHVAQSAHIICTSIVPQSSYQPYYSAILCGAQLPYSQFKSSMMATGLFHLMVVSGSHFVFIEQIFTTVFLKSSMRRDLILFLTLLVFAFCTLLAPPVFRALLSFMLRKMSEQEKLSWSPPFLTFASGLICLLIRPEWLTSLSFQLSWTASLLISLPMPNGIKKNGIIYLGLLPIFSALQLQHPATAVMNWIFAPIIGFLLLPLCFLATTLPALTTITDFAWYLLEVSLRFFAQFMPSHERVFLSYPIATWLYILTLQFLFRILYRNTNRKRLYA